jgi:hypothetical protein
MIYLRTGRETDDGISGQVLAQASSTNARSSFFEFAR